MAVPPSGLMAQWQSLPFSLGYEIFKIFSLSFSLLDDFNGVFE